MYTFCLCHVTTNASVSETGLLKLPVFSHRPCSNLAERCNIKKKSNDLNILKQGAYYHQYNMPPQTGIEKELANPEDISVFVNTILQTQMETFRQNVYNTTINCKPLAH